MHLSQLTARFLKRCAVTPEHLLIVFVLAFATGCASAPRVKSMIPSDRTPTLESTGASLSIGSAQGGSDTDPMWVSEINAEDFRLALTEALQRSNLFTSVAPDSEADYELTARILKQDQPLVGISMKVSMSVSYKITDTRSAELVFDERIVSTYTAKMGEAFSGAKRVRKANEGAVRENLSQLIEQIAALSLE